MGIDTISIYGLLFVIHPESPNSKSFSSWLLWTLPTCQHPCSANVTAFQSKYFPQNNVFHKRIATSPPCRSFASVVQVSKRSCDSGYTTFGQRPISGWQNQIKLVLNFSKVVIFCLTCNIQCTLALLESFCHLLPSLSLEFTKLSQLQ